MSVTASDRATANATALERFCTADPVLTDIRPALEVVPGMTPETILTSGAPLSWADYTGGQRDAIIGAALYEGLASNPQDADAKLSRGQIRVSPCHHHGCVGSMAGIYTASMPVFVVSNRAGGNIGFCNLYEGESRYRLNYGVYNDEVRDNLQFIGKVVAPILAAVIRASGGVELRPIIRRALNMGDELHSRNTAATLIFTRELLPALIEVAPQLPRETLDRTLEYLKASDYFFLRLSMAASKATADAAHGVPGSSLVTAMTWNCRDFAIRVSGLGDQWFRAELPSVHGKFFEGHTAADVEFMGGESIINETAGLGGFAQAAAFALQDYQGGTPDEMVRMNLDMYRITAGEHPVYRIPYLRFRGVPVGIDVFKVVQTGITPVMDVGIAGRGGGQIGAGFLRAPLACFKAAADALASLVPGSESD